VKNRIHRLPDWSTTLPLAQASPRCGAKDAERVPMPVSGQCRTVDAGCTAGLALGRAPRRDWNGCALQEGSTVTIEVMHFSRLITRHRRHRRFRSAHELRRDRLPSSQLRREEILIAGRRGREHPVLTFRPRQGAMRGL
jgi:hypothetical protein